MYIMGMYMWLVGGSFFPPDYLGLDLFLHSRWFSFRITDLLACYKKVDLCLALIIATQALTSATSPSNICWQDIPLGFDFEIFML